jgi:hypothetical protein
MYHAVCDMKGLLVSLKCLSELSPRGLMSALGQKQTHAVQQKRTARLWCPYAPDFYDFGVTRVACVALLIRIALSE